MVLENQCRPILYKNQFVKPNRITISKNADLAELFLKILPTANETTPILLDTQPGKGKTHGIIHGVVPWAMENNKRVAYISSRVSINTQTKAALIDAVGLPQLKEELTPKGIRVRTEFGPVSVFTYHRLFWEMQYHNEDLKKFDVMVFDEVHAPLEESGYVGTSGYVMKHLRMSFPYSIRIYMTATPEQIFPILSAKEGPYPINVYHMPRDYSFLKLRFFSKEEDIKRVINADTSDKKWLVFIPSITAGKAFCKELSQSCCMLNAETRKDNPEKWNQVLEQQCFPEKVCVVTAVVDAGVNLCDSALKNVVVFSTSPISYVQLLGRKRRKRGAKEVVNLYAWCPTQQKIESKLNRNLEVQEALRLFSESKQNFIQQYILEPENLDLRGMTYADIRGELRLNEPALTRLQDEQTLYQRFLNYAKENNDPHFFDHFVAQWFRLPVPDRAKSWIDETFSGSSKREFQGFLHQSCGQEMHEEDFQTFALDFQKKCIAAFGKAPGGKDRVDRLWKVDKINNKLEELKIPYAIECDRINKTYCLIRQESNQDL